MTERPIIFSAQGVRSILEGVKTQTRRLVKPEPNAGVRYSPGGGACEDGHGRPLRPLCVPGDRLWVRETWQFVDGNARYRNRNFEGPIPRARLGPAAPWRGVQNLRPITWRAVYRADGEVPAHKLYGRFCWDSPIYMPKWASRLTLEVTELRVQRLQQISEEDAKDEGARPFFETFAAFGREQRLTSGELAADGEHRAGFAVLWDEINANRATWKSNPWVWAVTFRKADT